MKGSEILRRRLAYTKKEAINLHEKATAWAQLLNSEGPDKKVTSWLLQVINGMLIIRPCFHHDLLSFICREVRTDFFSIVYWAVDSYDGLPCTIAATFSQEEDLLSVFSGKDGKLIFDGRGDMRDLVDKQMRAQFQKHNR